VSSARRAGRGSRGPRSVLIAVGILTVLAVVASVLHALLPAGGPTKGAKATTTPTSSRPTPAPTGPPGVTISSAAFLKDGAPLEMKGFNSVALVQPEGCPDPGRTPARAGAAYGPAMLDDMIRNWSADTIRFQISQPGMDPQDPQLSSGQPAYLRLVERGVKLARSKHLVVILSMQDQSYACGYAHPLPSTQTVRAWQALAPAFKDDPYVVFELFNEPGGTESRMSWRQWLAGGLGPEKNVGTDGTEYDVVGHQELLDVVRGLGARNVLLVDAVNTARRLQNLWTSQADNYLPADTLDPPQVGFAIHPYYYHVADNASLATDSELWYHNFGYLRDAARIEPHLQFPIVVTEWNASLECYAGQAERTPEFLEYLRGNGIGVLGHAIDVPGPLVVKVPGWEPNTFSSGGGECADGSGAGSALREFFREPGEQ